MTAKERIAFSLLVGAGAAMTTYFTMIFRERIETWELG